LCPEYTDKFLFVPEWRLCCRTDANDPEVGFEVLTSTYNKELTEDLELMEDASLDDETHHKLFLRHIFRSHLEDNLDGKELNREEKVAVLKRILHKMEAADVQMDADDVIDSFDQTSGEIKDFFTDRDASHGWCPPTVDGESYGQRFSIFQITIRLRRKASYYFLDPGLKERPPLSLVTGSIQGQPEAESVHVYVTSVIHNIPHINAVDATVSMRVKVSAFWRDDRLKHMWTQNVEPLEEPENLWHPNISIVNEDSIDFSLQHIRLLNKEGLLRADYDMIGTVHNHMDLHKFPLDTDIISFELHPHGQPFVRLHTADKFTDTTKCGGGRWEIFTKEEASIMASEAAQAYSKMLDYNPQSPSSEVTDNPVQSFDNYSDMDLKMLEDVARRHDVSLPPHHLRLTSEKRGEYRQALVAKIEQHVESEALRDTDEGQSLLPINGDGVHVLYGWLTLRDWKVKDSCAEELPGTNVAFLIRVTRKWHYFFCKSERNLCCG
jgi:hypothetical protein